MGGWGPPKQPQGILESATPIQRPQEPHGADRPLQGWWGPPRGGVERMWVQMVYVYFNKKKNMDEMVSFPFSSFFEAPKHMRNVLFFVPNSKCKDSTKTKFYSLLQKYTAISHSGGRRLDGIGTERLCVLQRPKDHATRRSTSTAKSP